MQYQKLDKLRSLNPNLLKNLEDWFKIELTYNSNAIEGNTLSRQETTLVINTPIFPEAFCEYQIKR
jgi:hypothetical protein